jgi:DNA-binding MarR family transcriptional regulator
VTTLLPVKQSGMEPDQRRVGGHGCRSTDRGPLGSAAITEPQTPSLDPQLELVRQVVLVVNDIGVAATKAIEDAGLGEWSPNVAITVLARVSTDGPTRPRDLLGPTRLTRGGLSNLFDRLEAAGLIERSYGDVPGDRRGATIAATDAGAEVATRISQIVALVLQEHQAALAQLTATLAVIDPHWRPQAVATPRTSTKQLEQLGRLGAALSESEALAFTTDDDPSPGHTAVVLCSAAQRGHTRPKELCERTGLTSGGVSQLLDRLEVANLIRRRTGLATDRRAVTIELTQQGHQRLERLLISASNHLSLLRLALSSPRKRDPANPKAAK